MSRNAYADHPLLPAAVGAYLASFDELLRARTENQLSDADEGMGRSRGLILALVGVTPRRMPPRARASLLNPRFRHPGTRRI